MEGTEWLREPRRLFCSHRCSNPSHPMGTAHHHNARCCRGSHALPADRHIAGRCMRAWNWFRWSWQSTSTISPSVGGGGAAGPHASATSRLTRSTESPISLTVLRVRESVAGAAVRVWLRLLCQPAAKCAGQNHERIMPFRTARARRRGGSPLRKVVRPADKELARFSLELPQSRLRRVPRLLRCLWRGVVCTLQPCEQDARGDYGRSRGVQSPASCGRRNTSVIALEVATWSQESDDAGILHALFCRLSTLRTREGETPPRASLCTGQSRTAAICKSCTVRTA